MLTGLVDDLRDRLAALDVDDLGALAEDAERIRGAFSGLADDGDEDVALSAVRCWDVLVQLGGAEYARRGGDPAALERWLAEFENAVADLDNLGLREVWMLLSMLHRPCSGVVPVLLTLRQMLGVLRMESERAGREARASWAGVESADLDGFTNPAALDPPDVIAGDDPEFGEEAVRQQVDALDDDAELSP